MVNNTPFVSVGGGLLQTFRVPLCSEAALHLGRSARVLLWPYPKLTPIRLFTGAGAGFGRNTGHLRLTPQAWAPDCPSVGSLWPQGRQSPAS